MNESRIEYRITKYNPLLRDDRGAYKESVWTTIRDVGKVYGEKLLTFEEYTRVEDAYVNSALAFLRESQITELRVNSLENTKDISLGFGEGSVLSLDEVGKMIPRLLREDVWCKLEDKNGFIHIGWDFYMYIGVPDRCELAEEIAVSLGLFPEQYESPYK